jgi:hypothetical protein
LNVGGGTGGHACAGGGGGVGRDGGGVAGRGVGVTAVGGVLGVGAGADARGAGTELGAGAGPSACLPARSWRIGALSFVWAWLMYRSNSSAFAWPKMAC